MPRKRRSTEFRFATKKAAPLKKIQYTQPVPIREAETPIGTIQGRDPASKEEWWIALGLWRLGWKGRFIYQYEVFGGRSRRGGQLIDFLVFTIPLPTPIYVNARYFHSRETEEMMKIHRVQSVMRGRWSDPLIIWDDTIPDEDAAYAVLATEIGRA